MPLNIDELEIEYEKVKARLSDLKNRRNFVQQERVRNRINQGNDKQLLYNFTR
jgi:hypothetical protein